MGAGDRFVRDQYTRLEPGLRLRAVADDDVSILQPRRCRDQLRGLQRLLACGVAQELDVLLVRERVRARGARAREGSRADRGDERARERGSQERDAARGR